MSVLHNSRAHALLSASNPDCDFILINRLVSRQLHSDLTRVIAANAKHQKALVVLTTFGGDPHGGYRTARCLRNHYQHVRLLVPSFCKSAGTLIAIGANELGIGDLGELGPMDIQVLKPGELQRGSGLDATQALQQCLQHALSGFISAFAYARQNLKLPQKLAAETASSVASGLLNPLYSQIDPLRLGEMQRAMAITMQYGMRLDGHSSNLKPGALNRLVIDYPAHEFVIDRKEARELFKQVTPLSDSEAEACMQLWPLLGTPASDPSTEFGPVFLLPEQHPTNPAPEGDAHVQPDPNVSVGAPSANQANVDAGLAAGAAPGAGGKKQRTRPRNR